LPDRRPQKYFGPRSSVRFQARADRLAIALDQAAAGLLRKQNLRDTGHQQRIDQPGQDRQSDEQADCGSED